jgi:hypothetical protein
MKIYFLLRIVSLELSTLLARIEVEKEHRGGELGECDDASRERESCETNDFFFKCERLI